MQIEELTGNVDASRKGQILQLINGAKYVRQIFIWDTVEITSSTQPGDITMYSEAVGKGSTLFGTGTRNYRDTSFANDGKTNSGEIYILTGMFKNYCQRNFTGVSAANAGNITNATKDRIDLEDDINDFESGVAGAFPYLEIKMAGDAVFSRTLLNMIPSLWCWNPHSNMYAANYLPFGKAGALYLDDKTKMTVDLSLAASVTLTQPLRLRVCFLGVALKPLDNFSKAKQIISKLQKVA